MPDDLRAQTLALADEYERRGRERIAAGRRQVAEGEEMLERAAVLRSALGEYEEGLPLARPERTIRSMDVNTQGMTERVRRGSARATRKHPALKKLYERNQTVTGLAAELKEGRPRVSSWFAGGDANRPIPRRHADYLAGKYEIPLTAWLRIGD